MKVYLCCGNKTGVAHPGEWTGFDVRRPCDVLQDVRTLAVRRFWNVEFVFATPPCSGFTDLPWRPATEEGLDVLEACYDICQVANDWLLENSRFAQKYIGKADYHHGGHYFWGTVRVRPFIHLKGRTSGRYPLRRAALPVILE